MTSPAVGHGGDEASRPQPAPRTPFERIEEVFLEGEHVLVDGVHRQADAFHPGEHGAQAIKTGRIEGGPEKTRAVAAIGHAGLVRGERPERGKPAGVARARHVARRAMHEADALTRHGVLVPAREIENPVRDQDEVRRQRHEAVIAVDGDQSVGVRTAPASAVEVSARSPPN